MKETSGLLSPKRFDFSAHYLCSWPAGYVVMLYVVFQASTGHDPKP